MSDGVGTVVVAVNEDDLAAITIGTVLVDVEYEKELLVATIDHGHIRVETEERYTPREGDTFGSSVEMEGEPASVVADGHAIGINELERLTIEGRISVGDVSKNQLADHLLDRDD